MAYYAELFIWLITGSFLRVIVRVAGRTRNLDLNPDKRKCGSVYGYGGMRT